MLSVVRSIRQFRRCVSTLTARFYIKDGPDDCLNVKDDIYFDMPGVFVPDSAVSGRSGNLEIVMRDRDVTPCLVRTDSDRSTHELWLKEFGLFSTQTSKENRGDIAALRKLFCDPVIKKSVQIPRNQPCKAPTRGVRRSRTC